MIGRYLSGCVVELSGSLWLQFGKSDLWTALSTIGKIIMQRASNERAGQIPQVLL